MRSQPGRIEYLGHLIGLSVGLIGLLGCSLVFYVQPLWAAENQNGRPEKTWKTLAELSDEERVEIDMAQDTPRDTNIPYLPAEAYPFRAPYTAEEMGFRAMEFPHMPRWNCVQVEDMGLLTPSGSLSSSQILVLSHYRKPEGLMGHLTAQPGELVAHWLTQDLSPPENYGNQMLFILYRTDQEKRTKADLFGYSPAIRRVRRFPQPQREDKMATWPMTFDDSLGRDAWEFSWRVLGTDILTETVRFPKTRPIITLATPEGVFTDVPVKDLKIMGDDYPHYQPNGGVSTYVLEARPKSDWLPDYYASKVVYWLEQHYFYPLRMEVYGQQDELIFVEERITQMMNPNLGDRGYHNLIAVWWDAQEDYYGYTVHDAMQVKDWSQKDVDVFFSPDFMRRGWFPAPLKTQAIIRTPEEFFLRPHLYKDKFPEERNLQLSPAIEARIRAQDAAGQIVFGEEPELVKTSLTSN